MKWNEISSSSSNPRIRCYCCCCWAAVSSCLFMIFCYFCLHSIRKMFNNTKHFKPYCAPFFRNDDLALIRQSMSLTCLSSTCCSFFFIVVAVVLVSYRYVHTQTEAITTRWLADLGLLSIHNIFKMHRHINARTSIIFDEWMNRRSIGWSRERAFIQALDWHEHVKYKYWTIN